MNNGDLHEIKEDIKELLRMAAQQEVMLLEQNKKHEALDKTTESIKSRLAPIETHVKLVNILLGVMGTLFMAVIARAMEWM